METINTLIFTLKTIYKINRKNLVFVIFMTMLLAIFPIITLQFTQVVFNTLQEGQKSLEELVQLILAYVVFLIVSAVISNIYSFYNNKLNIKTSYAMTEQFMERCSSLSLEELENSETYEKITRIENEIKSKPLEILRAILQMFSSAVSLIGLLGILLVWESVLAFFFLFYSMIQIIINFKIARQEFEMMYNRSEKERKIWYYTFLLSHDTGFKEIKILSLRDYFIERYKGLTATFIKEELKLSRRRLNLNTILIIIQEIFNGGVMFYAILESYKENILIGTAFTMISTLGMVYATIGGISDSLYILYNSSLYMKQWRDFLQFSEDNSTLEKTMISSVREISFENVCYQYNSGDRFNLDNINFQIQKGQRVAIVGRNGCGKSTILKLLVGLYLPKKGSICINKQDLNSLDKESYFRKISVLFQDFFKYEDTVLENIAISDISQKINIARIEDSLKKADFSLQNEEEDLVNIQLGNWFSDGQQLSGGEWQKIALARTYYKDADLVILDEPSAALDSLAESKIFQTFFDITKDKLGIFITHRVSIAKKADIILAIDNGRIDYIGDHEAMMNNSNVYKELYQFEKDSEYMVQTE